MTQLVGGPVVCDKCGKDCGNGNLTLCMVVSRINEEGHVDTRHFCEDTEENDKKVKGCASSLMTKTNLAALVERTEKEEAAAKKSEKPKKTTVKKPKKSE